MRGAKAAAWAWAIYPFAIYFSAGRVWEYALTALLFTTCFCIAQRMHSTANPLAWLGWGLLFGATALANIGAFHAPFLLLLALWKARTLTRRRLLNATLTAWPCSAVLTPWSLSQLPRPGRRLPVRDNYRGVFALYVGAGSRTPTHGPVHPASNPVEMWRTLVKWASRGLPGREAPRWPSRT